MNLLNEIRLLIVGLCFSIILFFVPKDTPEGHRTILAVWQWAQDEANNDLE